MNAEVLKIKALTTDLSAAAEALRCPFVNFNVVPVAGLDVPFRSSSERDFEIDLNYVEGESLRLPLKLPTSLHAEAFWWTGFLASSAHEFCRAFALKRARVRLSLISHNQCTLFHVDQVRVRFFQTLVGPGTEYLLEDNLNREGLGKGSNALVVKDFAKVKKVEGPAILLMRGELWYPNQGLVHRSPEISAVGAKRLCLCLDPIAP